MIPLEKCRILAHLLIKEMKIQKMISGDGTFKLLLRMLKNMCGVNPVSQINQTDLQKKEYLYIVSIDSMLNISLTNSDIAKQNPNEIRQFYSKCLNDLKLSFALGKSYYTTKVI